MTESDGTSTKRGPTISHARTSQAVPIPEAFDHDVSLYASAVTLADDINRESLALWQAPRHGLASLQPRMPLFYPELTGGGLVFVGLNPSFSDKAFRKLLLGDEWADFTPDTFYAWRDPIETADIDRARRIERLALDGYGYYKPFRALASDLSTTWDHVDVFLLRETSQPALLSQVLRGGAAEATVASLNDFGKAQLDLCLRVLERIAPRVLIVANAAACHLLADAFGARFDEKSGHHLVRLGGRDTPAFFSSMWTGQRALDRFSRQRLEWQSQRAYRELASKMVAH